MFWWECLNCVKIISSAPLKNSCVKQAPLWSSFFFPPLLPLLIISVVLSPLSPLLKEAVYGSDTNLSTHHISAAHLHTSASVFVCQ